VYRFALHSTGSSDPTLKNSISASCAAMASGSALSDINALPCPCAGVTAVYAPRCGQPLGCGLAALAVTAAALPRPLPLRCASLLCHAVQFRTSCSTHRQMHLWSSCGSVVIWKAAKRTKCMLCGSEVYSAADGEVAGYAPGTLAVSCAVHHDVLNQNVTLLLLLRQGGVGGAPAVWRAAPSAEPAPPRPLRWTSGRLLVQMPIASLFLWLPSETGRLHTRAQQLSGDCSCGCAAQRNMACPFPGFQAASCVRAAPQCVRRCNLPMHTITTWKRLLVQIRSTERPWSWSLAADCRRWRTGAWAAACWGGRRRRRSGPCRWTAAELTSQTAASPQASCPVLQCSSLAHGKLHTCMQGFTDEILLRVTEMHCICVDGDNDAYELAQAAAGPPWTTAHARQRAQRQPRPSPPRRISTTSASGDGGHPASLLLIVLASVPGIVAVLWQVAS